MFTDIHVVAVKVILDIMESLSPEDVEYLGEFIDLYHAGETEADRRAALESIVEILEQRPVTVRRLIERGEKPA